MKSIKKPQKGGVIIKTDPEKAIHFFIDNCQEIKILTTGSSSGVLFNCNLKPGVDSPYEMLRSENFREPVTNIIIKLVGVNSSVEDETDENYSPSSWTIEGVTPKKLEQEESFTREINIQTDIYLKTISYLEPICPAPIYANVIKIKSDAEEFVLKMLRHVKPNSENKRVLREILESIANSEIPYLGVLCMEIAEGYKTLWDCYSMQKGETIEDIRRFENMARLKFLELATKTGYSQNDFHAGNVMVNEKVKGFYNGKQGNVLLIDFGYADKIPLDKLRQIKQYISEEKFVEALKVFQSFYRPDDLAIDEYPSFYGWLYYSYDNLNERKMLYPNKTQREKMNRELARLLLAEDEAIAERIHFFNSELHSENRKQYPFLPVSNSIKNSLFEGVIEGGASKKKSRRKKKRRQNSKTKKTI
jgi:hypothetical protein